MVSTTTQKVIFLLLVLLVGCKPSYHQVCIKGCIEIHQNETKPLNTIRAECWAYDCPTHSTTPGQKMNSLMIIQNILLGFIVLFLGIKFCKEEYKKEIKNKLITQIEVEEWIKRI